MGVIYAITRLFAFPTGGFRPTTLDELLEKSERLWGKEIDVQNIRIVPSMMEPRADTSLGMIKESPYGVDILVRYSNGKELHIREPLPPLSEKETEDGTLEEELSRYAESLQRKLQKLWYGKPVVVYAPSDQHPSNGHSNGYDLGEHRGPIT